MFSGVSWNIAHCRELPARRETGRVVPVKLRHTGETRGVTIVLRGLGTHWMHASGVGPSIAPILHIVSLVVSVKLWNTEKTRSIRRNVLRVLRVLGTHGVETSPEPGASRRSRRVVAPVNWSQRREVALLQKLLKSVMFQVRLGH